MKWDCEQAGVKQRLALASPACRRPLEQGFTLLELLVVIAILALLASLLFTPVAAGLIGLTGTTSYADTNTSGAGSFFYRVGVSSP